MTNRGFFLLEQPDTWVRNQRNIFESVSKICCEIIESVWATDRALVNTFIVGLASRIHEKSDYEEQVTLNLSLSLISHLSCVALLISLIIWPSGWKREGSSYYTAECCTAAC